MGQCIGARESEPLEGQIHFGQIHFGLEAYSMCTLRSADAPCSCSECSTPGSPSHRSGSMTRSGSMRLAPEPLCNKRTLSSGTSSPGEPAVSEEEFLALQDLVAQTTLEAVVRITPAVLPTGSALRVDHVSGALPPLAYCCEDAPSCTQNGQNGKEMSSNLAFPAATELDAERATTNGAFGTVRGSLESSSEDTTVAESSICTSWALGPCWQGLMVSRGLVLGCTFALLAIVEVLFEVVKEGLSGEESLEVTLVRGSLRKTTLESITEEEEELDEESEGEELATLGSNATLSEGN